MPQAFLVAGANRSALRALNYTPEIERLRTRRREEVVGLGSLLAEMGPAYGSVFTRLDCDRSEGVELITQADMFAAEPAGRIIRRDSMAHPERHHVKRWQVLLAGAGTLGENELYGRAIIADSRLEGRYVGPHAMALTFKEPEADQSLFTYAFLLSAVGIRAVRATSYGTKILGLRKDLLREIPVPLPSPTICARVSASIRGSVQQREVYQRELRAAIDVLSQMEPRLGDSGGLYGRAAWISELGQAPTVTARNHRAAARAFPHGTPLMSLLCGGRPQKANRFARIPCALGYGEPFFGQRDLSLIRPIPQHIRPPESQKGLRAEAGSIIVAAAGQSGESTLFGRCELGDHFVGSLISEHTLHLKVDIDRISHRYLFAVLRSPWGMGALKSCATGTSVPSLDQTLLGLLRIPRLGEALERTVATHIENAYSARARAAQSESEALRAVEEQVLPEWLA